MPSISHDRNEWVKKQLDTIREHVDDMFLYQHALNIKDNVLGAKHLSCSFPKVTHNNKFLTKVCPGSTQIIQAMGRDEPLKPVLTPGRGSCWAAAFLLATVGHYNQKLIHEIRLR